MQEDTLREALIALNSTKINSTGSWLMGTCPLAKHTHQKGTDSKPSFGGTIGKKTFFNCFSCGFKGDLYKLILTLKNYKEPLDYKYLVELSESEYFVDDGFSLDTFEKKITYYPEEMLLAFTKCYDHEYLKSRGVDFDIASKLDFRFDILASRIVVPVRDYEGNLIGIHGRSLINKERPYHRYTHKSSTNTQFWLGEHWIDPSQPVILVESLFDLAQVLNIYPNCMCSLTASLSDASLERLSEFIEMILIFDNDKAGREAMYKIKKKYPEKIIKKVFLPEGKDPSDCTLDYLVQKIEQVDNF